MMDQLTKFSQQRAFTEDEQATWADVMHVQRPRRTKQLVPMFMEGLNKLGMDQDRIPELSEVNKKLKSLTGWQGVYVEGLEEGASFYQLLSERKFPIGNFIRDRKDLNYTPAPDIIHDLYGHIPFLADQKYADFNQKFGAMAIRHINKPGHFREFERIYWFTIEFGLMRTPQGVRIFGGGIASSIGECEYALSNQPKVKAFDLDVVRKQEFRIDQMQEILFLLESPEQLYAILPALEQAFA